MGLSVKALNEARTAGRMLEIPAESPDALSAVGGRVRFIDVDLASSLSGFGVVRYGSLQLGSLAPILAYLLDSPRIDMTDERVTPPQPALYPRRGASPTVSFLRVDGSPDWAAEIVDPIQ